MSSAQWWTILAYWRVDPAGEQAVARAEAGVLNPCLERGPSHLRDLELDGLVGFSLHDDGAGVDLAGEGDVGHEQGAQVAGAPLGINGSVEQRTIPQLVAQLQADPDGTGVLQIWGWLVT